MGTTFVTQRVAIIGAGKIGQPIGRHWVTAGHKVIFGSRTPAALDSFVARLGGSALATAPLDAVRASDVVLLAVPHPVLDELLGVVGPDLAGKVVIDATNPMGLAADGRIVSTLDPGVTQGRRTAMALPDSGVVRAFNHVMDELLWSRGTHQAHFWGMAIAGDDSAAKKIVSGLVHDAGFVPVNLGGLDDSAPLDPGGALFPHMFTPTDMRVTAGLKALCGSRTSIRGGTDVSDELLRDHVAIVALTVRMALHLDLCEWKQLTDLFTDKVLVDYSSLNGGDPELVSRADLVAKWRSNRIGLSATQHLVSNQLVEISEDRARADATAMFQATHVLPNPYGGPIWTLGGRYSYGLARTAEGWRIRALAMNIIWADGNRHIRDLAAERQAAS